MTIKTNGIKSETIQEAIKEIEIKYSITGDKAEAIASHIVYTDEDWTDEEPEEGEKQNHITLRDYKNLTDKDIWTTDAISCEFAFIGQEAICSEKTSSEATFFVPAETIPENFFRTQKRKNHESKCSGGR